MSGFKMHIIWLSSAFHCPSAQTSSAVVTSVILKPVLQAIWFDYKLISDQNIQLKLRCSQLLTFSSKSVCGIGSFLLMFAMLEAGGC